MDRVLLAILSFCRQAPLAASAHAQLVLAFLQALRRFLRAPRFSGKHLRGDSGGHRWQAAKTTDGILLTATGNFAGQAVDLVVAQNERRFEYGNRASPASTEPPAELWDALIVSFTRMGILHNIAALSAGVANNLVINRLLCKRAVLRDGLRTLACN
ncbi:MAG: hypothetical protein WDZ52_07895 [Pseudohongiellaceae bacterium]